MPTNATFLPNATAARWNTGNSVWHGPHHDAHLLTTTGKPFSDAIRWSNAVGPPPSSLLAWSCSEDSGGGESLNAALTRWCEGASFFGCDEPQPATTTAAASATSDIRKTTLEACHTPLAGPPSPHREVRRPRRGRITEGNKVPAQAEQLSSRGPRGVARNELPGVRSTRPRRRTGPPATSGLIHA